MLVIGVPHQVDQPLPDPSILESVLASASAMPRGERVSAIETALDTPAGLPWRGQIAGWVLRAVPVEFLVPEAYSRWRPLVREALEFVFSRLSSHRLATKIVEQHELPPDAAPEVRLLRLISKMPGLQKIGQVLARNRRLAPSLRRALSELENGLCDVTAEAMRDIIVDRLGPRLAQYGVVLAPEILSEASVSAVLRFACEYPGRERGNGVFKVLKPYVPEFFGEDMSLLEQLGEHLASGNTRYGFAARDVKEMIGEVRLLLEHELDFKREQKSLAEAYRMYRSSIGIRVPRPIEELCSTDITAMSEETGVKVTEAFPRSPIRRRRVAEQLVEALIAVPMFSRRDIAILHADPHAGNLFYDEPNRELIVLDWALAGRLDLESRRLLMLLAIMMMLRNEEGVRDTISALRRPESKTRARHAGIIDQRVREFFRQLPLNQPAGALESMRLLDSIALEGVRFPASLFLFRKILFTLDGVLHDVAGPDMRIDKVMAREFLTRWAASFGLFHAPLDGADLAAMPWNALRYSARRLFGWPSPRPESA